MKHSNTMKMTHKNQTRFILPYQDIFVRVSYAYKKFDWPKSQLNLACELYWFNKSSKQYQAQLFKYWHQTTEKKSVMGSFPCSITWRKWESLIWLWSLSWWFQEHLFHFLRMKIKRIMPVGKESIGARMHFENVLWSVCP